MAGDTTITVVGNLVADDVSAQGLAACLIDDCGLPIRARGRCHRHYVAWYRATAGTIRKPARNLKRRTVAERFASKVDRRGPDECWPWLPPSHKSGHGEFYVSPERGKVPSHTFALELATGAPCPPGREGCHHCDNPPCCNPAHIYYGTRQDNVSDMISRGRIPRGTQKPQAKLTEDAVLAMRERFAGGESMGILSAEYGVSDGLVSAIVNGRRGLWSHVGGPIRTHDKPGRRPKKANAA